MEIVLAVFGILTCVAVFLGFLWVLNFLFAPYDSSLGDWYDDDDEDI